MGLVITCYLSGVVSGLPTRGGQTPRVVARVNQHEITLEEVDEGVRDELRLLEEQIHELRRRSLERRVSSILLRDEARRRGVSVEELERSFTASVVVDPAEVEAVLSMNRDRFADKTPVQARELIAGTLSLQRKRAAYQEALDMLREQAEPTIHLQYPEQLLVRVDTSNDPVRGNPDARVEIVSFTDFQCVHCREASHVLRELRELYPSTLRIFHKDLPLDASGDSWKAALASECAHRQGRFWDFHDHLFENQEDYSPAALDRYAAELALDVPAFRSCLQGEESRRAVETDLRAARAHGVDGTPTFLINGRVLRGAAPLSRFRELISDQLERPLRGKEERH